MRSTNIIAWISLLVMVAALSSCGSKKAVATSGSSSSRSTSGSTQRQSAVIVSDDWSTLNIKLSRGDNAALYREVKGWLGAPYLYGGTTKRGCDCSGFVMSVYKKVYHIDTERNSALIFERNCTLIDVDDLKEGDLVFFHTSKRQDWSISHVGLYLKDNKFAHASSSRGVMISDITEEYWINHFVAAGRVKGLRK